MKYEPGLSWGLVVAISIAAGSSWLVSSLWPMILLVTAIAVDALARARVSTLRAAASYPPIYEKYEFSLELTDKLADALGLTADERLALQSYPIRPVGFVLERWAEFLRWRVFQVEDGHTREWTVDFHEEDAVESAHITFWKAALGSGLIVFDWQESPSKVRLYVEGGRFESGVFYKEPEHTSLFCLHLPLPHPWLRRLDLERSQYRDEPEPIDALLVERAGRREIYQCDRHEKGFRWTLTRWDLRPHLLARVERIHKKRWTRTKKLLQNPAWPIVGITLTLQDTKLSLRWPKVEADPRMVEPDRAGRTMPHRGEFVRLVFDQELRVDCILPVGDFYGPVSCPECKQPYGLMWQADRNSDGVCHKCRPPKKCSRCYKEIDQKLLREKQGELVCDRCGNRAA